MVVQAPTTSFPAHPAASSATRPARPGLLGALAALVERVTAPEAQATPDERYWQSVARGL